MLCVVDVEIVILHLRIDRVSQNVAERSFVDAGDCVSEHRAFTKSASADGNLLERKARKHRFHDGKCAREYIRSTAGQALYLHRAVEIELFDGVVDIVKFAYGQLIVVRHIERVLLYHTANSAEIAETASDTHKRRIRLYTVKPRNFFELFTDKLFDFLCSFLRGRGVVFEQIRKRNRAERQCFVVNEISSIVVNKIGRTSAHFHNQALGNIHRVDYALVYEHSLLFGRKHFYLDTASHCDFVKKTLLIFCTSHRRRGIRKDFVDLVCVAQTTEHR